MFNITIISIGKIKERHLQSIISEYAKRISPYAKMQFVELASEAFRSDADKVQAKMKEGERILKFLENKEAQNIILLDEHGEKFDSTQFAEFLESKQEPIFLVIGGPLGFSEEILAKPWKKISLSALTFPHEMAQALLLEQIYRAITIIKGKEYHY